MFKDLFLLGGVVASVISPSFKDSITGSDIFFINGKYNVIENEEQYKKMTVDVSSNQMTGYDAMDKNFMMSQKSFNEIDEFQNFYVQINCMMEKNDNDDEIIDFIKYNIENNLYVIIFKKTTMLIVKGY